MKKKILLPLLMLCIGSCAVATATGCDKGGQTEPTTMETLISKDSITLELNQEYTLDLVYDGEETPTWTVGDSTIVSVENGKLVALKSGTTTVTVTVGSYTDTVKVTVSEMDTAKLSLEVADSNVTLYKNDEKQIVATVKYNGVVIDSAAEKSYESTNADIVSVDANGKMTAKAYGNATITVNYKVNGTTLLSSVNVSVVSAGKVEITQSFVELTYGDPDVTLTAKATEKGVEQTNATITWSATAGQDVITLSADGKIKVLNVGETDVTATYEDNDGQTQTDTITVTVSQKIVDKTSTTVEASTDKDDDKYQLNRTALGIDSNVQIQNVYIVKDGSTLNVECDNDEKLDFGGFIPGEGVLCFNTKNVLYKVGLELEGPVYLNSNNFTTELQAVTYDYYKLDEDITLADAWTTSATFSGTLDGNGHSITGLSVATKTGLFSVLKNATIKNVSVVDATLSAEETGVFAWKTEGTVTFDNVYVSIAETVFGEYYANAKDMPAYVLSNQSQKAGLICQSDANVTVKNSVIYMPEFLPTAHGFILAKGNATLTVQASTFIGGNGKLVGSQNVTQSGATICDAVAAYKALYGNDFDKTQKENTNGWSNMIVAAYEANHPLKVFGDTDVTQANFDLLTSEIVVLTEDVTLSSSTYLGNASTFTGVFDGQEHSITGFKSKAGGLFSRLYGSVKNLKLVGALSSSSGLIADRIGNTTYLDNLYLEITACGSGNEGALARWITSGSVSMKDVVINVNAFYGNKNGVIAGFISDSGRSTPVGLYMDNCSFVAPENRPLGDRGDAKYVQVGAGNVGDFFWDIDTNHTTDDGLTYYATVAALQAGVSGLSTFLTDIVNGLE